MGKLKALPMDEAVRLGKKILLQRRNRDEENKRRAESFQYRWFPTFSDFYTELRKQHLRDMSRGFRI